MLIRNRTGEISQTAGVVHLVPAPSEREADMLVAACGGRLAPEEIEVVDLGVGMPCTACLASWAVVRGASAASCESEHADIAWDRAYSAWGWPVTQEPGLIQLNLDCDVSAIAIPTPLSAEVARVLTARHCAPAVLAHPYAPEHHMVLTSEKFGAALPWPSGVYQVSGSVMLPPTMTFCGPITWVQPPSKDSLRLSREIDVFGALRAVVSH